ncbi:SAF domain-containing protein [Cellulomonas sp. ACRRI]|uniref:SAF domain-containing protein n=1 Tax=Cellulomonas sp. ACRRI TaxID=2918188 RepID=UPI001EF23FEC|nr:SAF domain-containing protein [Cellulomonas sp. ACRRI]MCG7284932.1 SAF domain-containing protein [Cellulomonas sp. ACRRI]
MPLTDPLPEPVRRRLRLIGWRVRRPLAALCAGLAALVAVGLARPADPPTARVPVAARDLAVGAVLAAGDVRLAEVPLALVPAGLAGDGGSRSTRTGADELVGADAEALGGRRLAVAVPAGLPLVPGLFVDDGATGPPGTVVVPVRFADAGVADVLTPGMRVDVVAAALHDGDDATRLARAAVVLARPGGDADPATGSGGGLLGGSTAAAESAPVLLAVAPEDSVALSGAAASRVLSAVIVG